MAGSKVYVHGSLLRDAAILAVARLEAMTASLPAWSVADADGLRSEAARLTNRHVHAAQVLAPHAKRLVVGIDLVPFLEPGGPFGPAWAGHAFASEGLQDRVKLREPDLTSELARLLGPAAGRRGAERCRSFLRIVAELAGDEALRKALTDEIRPTVTPEHCVGVSRRGIKVARQAGSSGQRRLDLLFEWMLSPGGRQAVVAVEVKLGAAVSGGQLRSYAEAARRRAQSGLVALILLTATPDGAERRNRSWRPVRWFALLRRWETALAIAGDADPDFARIRARLWRYLLANPGALR